jgi:hypothetical protein
VQANGCKKFLSTGPWSKSPKDIFFLNQLAMKNVVAKIIPFFCQHQ